MKKFVKTMSLLLSIVLIGAFAVGCVGGTKVENKDKRPTIFISVFNGGYGKDWLDVMVKDFNEQNPDNAYQIQVRDSKDEFNAIAGQIQAGTAVYDMFFSNAEIYKLINGNFLEPVTDIVNATPEGSDKSFRDMLTRKEYLDAYSGADGEIYALPFQESIKGFVYDHDIFTKYGLLFNEAGNFITSPDETLSKGKDGVAGTYDDGHPKTEEEWEAMVIKATQVLGTAFSYSGKFANYLNDLYFALHAQIDGVEGFKMQYTLSGTYDLDGDGTKETEITPENGYLIDGAPGRIKALKFMDKYLACKDAKLNIATPYVNSKSGALSYSHTDAQNDYILYSAQNKKNKIAMLYEGDWWENEARVTFKALEDDKNTDYTFRTRNYKYMTLPVFEGQKETGNVFPIGEAMYVALKKQTDETKKSVCKAFLKFMYQPKYIQNYAVTCGGVMPFDVKLTEEQEKQLSPFAKNFREIYYDTNNKFVSNQLMVNTCDTVKAGLSSTTSNGSQYIVMNGLYYYDADEYVAKQKAYHSENWATNYQAYLNYMQLKG